MPKKIAAGMTHLEDIVLIFHEPDCPGLITSDDAGGLHCDECGRQVGWIEPAVLAFCLGLLEQCYGQFFKNSLDIQAARSAKPRR